MILVKDRTGSKNGTADSTLVGVFDSKRPLYRIVKWLTGFKTHKTGAG